MYTFKLYGGHDFINLSHKEIKEDYKIVRLINPIDLLYIHKKEYDFQIENTKYKIIEYLRNNHYKISDGIHTDISSGEDICNNIDILKNINSYDLYKISYETGFLHGRKSTIQMTENKKGNVIRYSDKKVMYINKINSKK